MPVAVAKANIFLLRCVLGGRGGSAHHEVEGVVAFSLLSFLHFPCDPTVLRVLPRMSAGSVKCTSRIHWETKCCPSCLILRHVAWIDSNTWPSCRKPCVHDAFAFCCVAGLICFCVWRLFFSTIFIERLDFFFLSVCGVLESRLCCPFKMSQGAFLPPLFYEGICVRLALFLFLSHDR